MNDLNNTFTLIVDEFSKKDFQPALKVISALIRAYIEQNFAANGRWDGKGTGLFSGGNQKWVQLAASTKKKYKRKGYDLQPTLYRSGQLANSIEVKPIGNSIVISTGIKYAAIHQLGGQIKKRNSGSFIMPARPFITLSPDDLKEITNYFANYLIL